jgi:hypothetical protein
MVERGLVMYAPEVNGVLDGRQTQFRRVVKPQPPKDFRYGDVAPLSNGLDRWAVGRSILHPNGSGAWPADPLPGFLCPYGLVGDRLWVRETFCMYDLGTGPRYDYRATCSKTLDVNTAWTSSTQMPRRASRITLEVVGVRLEQVQDITPQEIEAEGIVIPGHHRGELHSPSRWKQDHWEPYWNASSPAVRGLLSYDDNPWVFAVEFKVKE